MEKTFQKWFDLKYINMIYGYLRVSSDEQDGRIQRANALHRKVIKSFRKNTQKEYKNLIFLLVED